MMTYNLSQTLLWYLLGCALVALNSSGCCPKCDDPEVCMEPECIERCGMEATCNSLQNPQLLSFQLTSPVTAIGDINESARRITVVVPHSTDLRNARASFSATEGARVTPNPTGNFDLSSRSIDLVVQTNIASKTYTLEVEIARPDLPSFAEHWYQIFNNQGIGAACAVFHWEDEAYLFNQAGDRYVWVKDGRVLEYAISNSQGPLKGCAALSGITAAQLAPNGNQYLFTDEGEKWAVHNRQGCKAPEALYSFGEDGTHPFRNFGVEAALLYRQEGHTGHNQERTFHFSAETSNQRAVLYDHNPNDPTFKAPVYLDNWGGGIPFNRVGAALHLRVNLRELYPDQVSANKWGDVQILFNGAGTHFVCYHYDKQLPVEQLYGYSDIYPIVEE